MVGDSRQSGGPRVKTGSTSINCHATTSKGFVEEDVPPDADMQSRPHLVTSAVSAYSTIDSKK